MTRLICLLTLLNDRGLVDDTVTGFHRSGERDQCDLGVFNQVVADHRAAAGNVVEDSRPAGPAS
jgi:hypothetical protein